MKRILSPALFLVIFCSRLYGQAGTGDTLPSDGLRNHNPGKLRYSVTLGSEFSTVSGYGSAISSVIQPQFSYNLSSRFTIGGGFGIIQTNYFNARPLGNREANVASSGNFTSGLVFLNGRYLFNDRLALTGSAYKQFPITRDPLPYNPFDPVSSKGAQGVDFNVGYRLGKNMYIQAGFHYADGLNPYNYDPFGGTGSLLDPFGNSRFYRGTGWER